MATRNPGSTHQLRLIVYPIIYRVSAPSQVVVWDFSHQQKGKGVFLGGIFSIKVGLVRFLDFDF